MIRFLISAIYLCSYSLRTQPAPNRRGAFLISAQSRCRCRREEHQASHGFGEAAMRFSFPLLPAEVEIPDQWWTEASMTGFAPAGPAYRSTAAATHTIPLRQIEPPVRNLDHPLDFRGFRRERMVRILSGFVAGAEIDRVPLFALASLDWWLPSPFQYRVRDGMHRFYASVSAGFECLPVTIP
jgi:hypothetical protein